MTTIIGLSILGAIVIYTLTMIFYGTIIYLKLKQEDEYEELIYDNTWTVNEITTKETTNSST